MARFGVYRIGTSLVLDVQAELLDALATRVVVPLLAEDRAPKPIRDLNPVFEIEGTRCVMATQALAAVPVKELLRCGVSLSAHRDEITKALDILLTGF
jgi:toxin CcdB